jgi:hypothetical protein
MRNALDLDEEPVVALVELHPALSRAEAIEVAARPYLEASAAKGLHRLAGTMEIKAVFRALRSIDRSP